MYSQNVLYIVPTKLYGIATVVRTDDAEYKMGKIERMHWQRSHTCTGSLSERLCDLQDYV